MALAPITEDTFAAEVLPQWHVVRGPNGGYLAALLLQAMGLRLGDPVRRPRVLSAHFLRVPRPGAVEVRVRVLRSGRSITWLGAELRRGDEVFVDARAAFSTQWEGIEYAEIAPPSLPPPEWGVSRPEGLAVPRFTDNYDYRMFYSQPGQPDGSGRVGGYIRPRDAEGYGAPLLTAMTDAWFPATFAHDDRMAMAATIDLTVHFRDHAALEALSAEDFVMAVFRSGLSNEGFFEEDGQLWTREGRLLAQSRQLAIATPIGG